MSKLLNKPLKVFAVYALVILAASIPAYYFIIDAIWIEELDEHNYIIREQTQAGFDKITASTEDLNRSIALWTRVQPGIAIEAVENAGKDSIYTISRVVAHNGEVETDRFRGLISYIQIDHRPYRMRIETNVEEADETVLAISLITFVFIGLLILGFILLNKRLSKKIWEPFTDTLEKLKRFDLSTASTIDLKHTDIEEFFELNQVLNRLIDSNINAYRQQKEFVQNASHELQTPLALLRSKIDLLIQDNTLTEKQREIIQALSDSVSRVSRINKNLLLLAAIENKLYTSEKISVNEVVTRTLSGFKEYAPGNREIAEQLQDQVTITANEGLLEILVTNLLSNAFRHSRDTAILSVTLQERKLIIRNTGAQPLNQQALFKRFQSATPENPGTGLGLAISQEICTKYGWQISYSFSGNEHSFVVAF